MKQRLKILLALLALFFFRTTHSGNPPNVILLTVDTLRADRLSGYGYRLKTSPHLDHLTAKGTLFLDATTNVPLTNPAFSSLFTSRYPHETGAIRNGIPMVGGIPTLAMMLKKYGYHTAAIISNWPLKRHLSNLQQGFDLYDDDFHEKRWLVFNDERDAEGVTERALAWLDIKPAEPFFLWVHYSDPHAPYQEHSGFTFSEADQTSARYDSEVAYTDHYIGELMARLNSSGLLARSLLVFTADHGESLGEHGYVGHGRDVYQPSLRVPLAVIGPGLPAGTREKAPVQLLDLAPTILAYVGVPPRSDMRGTSLLPFLKGEAPYPGRAIFYETYPGAAPQVEGAEKMLTRPIWVGYRQAGEKLMFNVRYQKWEKYNLGNDPAELTNLVKLRDPAFLRESDLLMAWFQEWENKTVVGKIGVMTEEDRAKFRAMGYVDGP